MEIIYFLLLLVLGLGLGYFLGQAKSKQALAEQAQQAQQTLSQVQLEYGSFKAQADAIRGGLEDKLLSKEQELEAKRKEMSELNQQLKTEFELLATQILEGKSQKLSEVNAEHLKKVLDPLGQNLKEFKDQVRQAYEIEARERFSLGKELKELANINRSLGDEAKNLTKALKGEAKTQGLWGEMILESILEKSGLRKGEEYFMEYQLFDAQGKALRSELEGKKMRPDALVKYPDQRHVIIDSKVSLNAYVRACETEDALIQTQEIQAHVLAIKNHVQDLSKKAYDDYDKTLDFVMMFIPNESAYIAAVQQDPNLWNYAYERRILLISPSNLVAALKMLVDLWKREHQNQNAQAIAERGAKLYDKFVGFIENLRSVGDALNKAQSKYEESFKQLSTGNDNLMTQADKLRRLGLKTKKQLDIGPGEED